jgi:hypothetical protein
MPRRLREVERSPPEALPPSSPERDVVGAEASKSAAISGAEVEREAPEDSAERVKEEVGPVSSVSKTCSSVSVEPGGTSSVVLPDLMRVEGSGEGAGGPMKE